MALLSDNSDIQESYLVVNQGNDSDYYPTIITVDENGLYHSSSIRIAMSGGNAPTDVKLAMAQLYRALEKHNLNAYPVQL